MSTEKASTSRNDKSATISMNLLNYTFRNFSKQGGVFARRLLVAYKCKTAQGVCANRSMRNFQHLAVCRTQLLPGDVPNFESEVGARAQILNGFSRRVNKPLPITNSTVISPCQGRRQNVPLGRSKSVIAMGRKAKQQIRLTPYTSDYSGHCQRGQLRLSP